MDCGMFVDSCFDPESASLGSAFNAHMQPLMKQSSIC
jgi:hypothetical protein